jgi:hypothetical protein
MSLAKREPRSPYARYGKRPFAYSENYQRWHNAALSPNSDDAERGEYSRKHSIQFLGFDPKDYPTGRYPGTTKENLK